MFWELFEWDHASCMKLDDAESAMCIKPLL